RLLRARRGPDLARRSDPCIARAAARRRVDCAAACLAPSRVPATGAAQASRRCARAHGDPRLRACGRGKPTATATRSRGRCLAPAVRHGDRHPVTVAATAGFAGGGWSSNDSGLREKSSWLAKRAGLFAVRLRVVAALDAGWAAPVLALAGEAHGLAAVPAEVRGALELAGLAGLPEALLPCRRGDHMTGAGQT